MFRPPGAVARPAAQGLTDVAQSAAALKGDESTSHRGVFRVITAVDILDDLLPSIGLEIQVDIGHGLALGREKTFEDQS